MSEAMLEILKNGVWETLYMTIVSTIFAHCMVL